MILIIPIGGLGERFKKRKYDKPKALINVLGKPMIFYLLDNLELGKFNIIMIIYHYEYKNYGFEDLIKKNYNSINFEFCMVNQNTNGAAETINIGLCRLNRLKIKDMPILCLDSDNFYIIDIINLWDNKNCIFSFYDEKSYPIYSYVKINESNNLITIAEKNKISNFACTGAYGFNSFKNLHKNIDYIIKNDIRMNNEYYMSCVIKTMIDNNITFKNVVIDKNNFYCLGTPLQLRCFCNKIPQSEWFKNKIRKQNISFCFNLEASFINKKEVNDKLIKYRINQIMKLIIYLDKLGNNISIKDSLKYLDKYNLSLNENNNIKIIRKLPNNLDFYINDFPNKTIGMIERQIGFYLENIVPRTFNSIEYKSPHEVVKRGKDLSGEIYYYKNIPDSVNDLFPKLIEFDINNKYYKMEKIYGLCLSNVYLDHLLTKNILKLVMEQLRRIQRVKITNNNNINLYDNYSKKLIARYKKYDYSIFHKSDELFLELLEKLKIYEENDNGKLKVIHGDFVMTNIIINEYNTIKLIDMRGKLGDNYTICGDWLYDWGKLYQSIIGYDSILLNKELNSEYLKMMKEYFEEYFIDIFGLEDFENLRLITKSHLFSLIPLHDSDKCINFYDLIYKV